MRGCWLVPISQASVFQSQDIPVDGFWKVQGLNCCLWLSGGQVNWMSVITSWWEALGPHQSCCGRHILLTDCPPGIRSPWTITCFMLHARVSKPVGGLGESASDNVNVNISYLMSHSFQINSVFHDSDTYFWVNNKMNMFLRYITTLTL